MNQKSYQAIFPGLAGIGMRGEGRECPLPNEWVCTNERFAENLYVVVASWLLEFGDEFVGQVLKVIRPVTIGLIFKNCLAESRRFRQGYVRANDRTH